MVFMTGLLRLPPTLHAAGLPPGVVPIGGGAVAVIEPVAEPVVLVVYHPELGEARIHLEQLAHYQGRGYALERPKPAAVATGITTPKPKPQPGPLPKPPRPTGR